MLKLSTLVVLALALPSFAQVPVWGQCKCSHLCLLPLLNDHRRWWEELGWPGMHIALLLKIDPLTAILDYL